MAVFLMAAAHGEEGNEGISRTDVGSKDYGTIYRRPDLENHIKPYIYDYLWTSLSHTHKRGEKEAILLTEAKWLLGGIELRWWGEYGFLVYGFG